MIELENLQSRYLEAKLQNSYRNAVELERENEDLRTLLDKASRAISCFVDLRGMTASELAMTANIREWRHFFRLRAAPTAHPQLRTLVNKLLVELKTKLPTIFGDL